MSSSGRDSVLTADSIAAWIAGCWRADEVMLLKSCDPPTLSSEWCQQGFVDTYCVAFDIAENRVLWKTLVVSGSVEANSIASIMRSCSARGGA